MKFDDVINQRRSIRNYKKLEAIEKKEIEQMIEAALMAPSWKNSETARYYVALSQDYINMVMKCLPEFNQRNSLNAGALVVTTFKKNISGFDNEGKAVNEVGQGWGCYDLGLANENFVLKAAQMGYGTLIMGIRDSKKLREVFNILEDEEVVVVIAVGKAEMSPAMPKRRELSEVVKFFN